ncbi:ABC transporter ATP-binding protein [Aquabacterium sp. OR-4]|uniref:ABC transporter ATP-binding protein n=1 Tax=Aquabacterium sp. OR-4 TaxID=2978127 RepID=UPI0021B17F9C|nr:ABC transporter ATP-binding protein [Aquabacterium sp. OR-4]MDT7833675.1 ABC transporter ATP-binding protein [Aquabacterium sp. OR-4]
MVTASIDGRDAAVRLDSVVKRYGEHAALDGVSLTVARGQLFGLIGHNGAGKSTLFKLLLNLIAPTSGRLWIGGREVLGTASRDTRRRVGYLPENLVLYDNLDGLETLRFFARMKGAPLDSCAELLERVGLGGVGRKPVRGYSKGMRQRLGFAQALLGAPELLLLDEPTTGLDPAGTRDFFGQLQRLRDAGVTLLISSHVLAELQGRVDALAMLAGGRLAAQGTVQQLRERSALPLRLLVSAAADRLDALPAALCGHDGLVLQRQAPELLQLALPRAQKMAVLGLLANHGVDDLQLHEPTLEDVYFDVRSAA